MVGHRGRGSVEAAKMDMAKFGVLYKERTLGSDPVNCSLSKGNVAEVALENNPVGTGPLIKCYLNIGCQYCLNPIM